MRKNPNYFVTLHAKLYENELRLETGYEMLKMKIE